MTKEFEALDELFDLIFSQDSFEKAQKCYDILEEALTELQAIKEAKPNEAMEDLDNIIRGFNETTTGMYGLGEVVVGNELEYCYKNELNTIKATLQQAEKLEKAWEVVNNKEVNMIRFKAVVMLNGNANDYNKNEEYKERHLTEEEFDLLKEMLK